MSDALHHDAADLWHPPTTFRETLEDTERVASLLLHQLEGQLLVRTVDLEFLARRLQNLARAANRALPPEVS